MATLLAVISQSNRSLQDPEEDTVNIPGQKGITLKSGSTRRETGLTYDNSNRPLTASSAVPLSTSAVGGVVERDRALLRTFSSTKFFRADTGSLCRIITRSSNWQTVREQ